MSKRDGELPQLSFVVPVYNPPVAVLGRMLASIARQTEPRWEGVLVDDGSTDPDVRAELIAWSKRERRFRVVSRADNGGIAAATNTGIDAARADVLAFVDHDDLVSSDAAERLLDHFARNPNDDVVYSDEELIDGNDHVIVPYHKPDYSPIRHLGHHYLCHLLAMRRSAIGDLRVRPDYEPAQDADFVLRVIEAAAERGRSVGHLPCTLYQWRAIEGSIALDVGQKSGTANAIARSTQAALERRRIDADVRPVEIDGLPTTNMRITFPPQPIDLIERVAISSAAEVAERLDATDRPYLYLAIGDESGEAATALAAEAAHDGIGMVGPALLHPDNSIASVGRLVAPTLTDAFSGEPWGVGPWGSFLVTREVGAIAPEGAVIDVAAARAAGGLPADVGLDAGLAELAERMRRLGSATVWTPSVQLTVDRLSIDRDPDVAADEWALCRGRLGDVRERFDTTGLQHHAVARPTPIRAARDLILTGSVDLVTSDVFDTIVTRHVATPSDLFVHLGRDLIRDGLLPSGVSPVQFALARRVAERAARATAAEQFDLADRAPECTLEEIWRAMPADWRLNVDDMADRELETEIRHLRPLAPALGALQLAHRRGAPVVLVSDTYLSSQQLARVLAGCGIDTSVFDRIVTSSDRRRGKANDLLAHVIAEMSVEPARVLHLGDSDEADVAAGERAGARVVQVALPKHSRFVPIPTPQLERFSRRTGSDGGIVAAVRAVATEVGPAAHDASYQFGLSAAGPALAGFARWVAATADDLGASSIHYLLREGATIADLVATVAPDAPTARLVHASRWVDLRAAVVNGTTIELAEALGRRGPTTAGHVAEAFGVDPADVRRVWGGEDVLASSRLWAACESLSGDERLRRSIVAHAADLRARVMRQLRRELEPGALDGGSGPIVICDVGWGATIQAALERILRAEGVEVTVVGLYLALSEPGEDRSALGHRLLSYLPNELDDPDAAIQSRSIAHHADTVERLLMPATGTFVDVAEDGTAVTASGVEPHPISLLSAKQGVFDLARQLASHGFDDELWVDSLEFRSVLAAGLAQTITFPAPELARVLSQWPHDDVAGADPIPIGGSSTLSLIPYLTIREVQMLREAGRVWIEGLAAVENPALAAQMAAVRVGLHAEHLAPSAVTGASRLAVFPVDSDLACLQLEQELGVTVDGWSVLRLAGTYPSLRSVRFDAGTSPALVEIARWSVRIERAGHPPVDLDVVGARRELVLVGAWPLGPRRYVETGDGHTIFPVRPDLGGDGGRIEVVVVFRRWSLDQGDDLLVPTARRRVTHVAQRVRRAAVRRLGTALVAKQRPR